VQLTCIVVLGGGLFATPLGVLKKRGKMKLVKSLLLILFLVNSLFSQQYLGDNKLVVEGEATKIIESDRASFNFSVTGFGESLRSAIADARAKVNNATKVLSEYDIPEHNISTSTFESGENYGDKAFWSSSKDFKTLMTVYVIVDSLKDLEEIIVNLSEVGIDKITNINYSLHEIEKYANQVKIDAIENAKTKAEMIANEFGVKLIKVIYIEESGFYQHYPNPFNPPSKIRSETIMMMNSLYSKPVKLNQIIKVVYEIE